MERKNLKQIINKPSDKEALKSARLSIPVNNEEWTWSNLPLLTLILIYLNQKDIIQLSSVCKSFRSRLEPTIFHKIKLFPDDYLSDPLQYGKKLNKRGIQFILLDRVIQTLNSKSHLVKEIVIKDGFDIKYAKQCFSKFSSIKNLTILNVGIKMHILVEILKPLGQLEHFHINLLKYSGSINSATYISNYRLPNTIQTVKIEGYSKYPGRLDSILEIDETYTNLISFTVTNIENLIQFTKYHPNLIELDILPYSFVNANLVEDVVANNPQLTTLAIPGFSLSQTTINNILTRNQISTLKLRFLNIYLGYNYTDLEFNYTALVDNEAITTIEFIQCFSTELTSIFLNYCKNLVAIKFTGNNVNFEGIDWKNYQGNLKQIELEKSNFYSIDYDKLIECNSLKKVILTKDNESEWGPVVIRNLDELKFWQVNKGDQIVLNRLTRINNAK